MWREIFFFLQQQRVCFHNTQFYSVLLWQSILVGLQVFYKGFACDGQTAVILFRGKVRFLTLFQTFFILRIRFHCENHIVLHVGTHQL